MSLADGVEPDPNLLLPVKFAETPSIKLKPENENIFPPKAMSLSTRRLDAVIAPLALILTASILPLAVIFVTVKLFEIVTLSVRPITILPGVPVTSISFVVPVIEDDKEAVAASIAPEIADEMSLFSS